MVEIKGAVIVESPYGSEDAEIVRRNEEYARACLRDCLLRGYAPFASHLLYTQAGVLCDRIPEERELGIEAGLYIGRLIGEAGGQSVTYTDKGISRGMRYGIDSAKRESRPIEYRQIYGRELGRSFLSSSWHPGVIG